jgi:hypothetical protein
MSRQSQACDGSFLELRTIVFLRARAGRVGIVSLAWLMAGCAPPPMAPFGGPDPSDPSAPAPSVSYRSTIGPFAKLRPVEPAAWTKSNKPDAPASKSVPEPKS